MASSAYTYEPGNIKEFGKDRMRFELGDTMVEGGSDTTALTDVCQAGKSVQRFHR